MVGCRGSGSERSKEGLDRRCQDSVARLISEFGFRDMDEKYGVSVRRVQLFLMLFYAG
jgi:hypothetical protein